MSFADLPVSSLKLDGLTIQQVLHNGSSERRGKERKRNSVGEKERKIAGKRVAAQRQVFFYSGKTVKDRIQTTSSMYEGRKEFLIRSIVASDSPMTRRRISSRLSPADPISQRRLTFARRVHAERRIRSTLLMSNRGSTECLSRLASPCRRTNLRHHFRTALRNLSPSAIEISHASPL